MTRAAPATGPRVLLRYVALLLLVLATLVPAVSIPAGGASASPEVTGIRFGLHPGTTRIVLDVTEPLRFEAHALDRPFRLIVDLPEVAWRVPEAAGNPRGMVTGHRYGLFRPGTSRLVLDVDGPFRVGRTLTLPPEGTRPHRLVIDLESVADAAFERAPPPARSERGPPRPPGEDAGATAGESRTAAPAPDPPPTPMPRPELTATSPAKPVVVIDPGHGGVDPGTIGVTGVLEKEVTLEVARELRRRLEESGRYRVVMTRDEDVFVRLRDRLQIAREAGGDLFVSLHADSIGDSGFRGASVYTLSDEASDEEAAMLARKENRVDVLSGTDLSNHDDIVTSILIDLAQRDTNNKSIEFARILVAELGEVTRMVRRTRRFAGFTVLRSPDVPSVLVELGYLSSREDEEQLTSPEHHRRLSAAFLRALDRHFGEHAS